MADLMHRSDRGVQYRSVVYTNRLDKIWCGNIGRILKGDSYNKTLAEALEGSLYKAELINHAGHPGGIWPR